MLVQPSVDIATQYGGPCCANQTALTEQKFYPEAQSQGYPPRRATAFCISTSYLIFGFSNPSIFILIFIMSSRISSLADSFSSNQVEVSIRFKRFSRPHFRSSRQLSLPSLEQQQEVLRRFLLH